MTLEIKRVLDVVGEKLDFAGAIDLSWVVRHGAVLFPDALAVEGEISNRAGVVTLRYQISGAMPYVCDRCLMQSERSISEQFQHPVVRELEDPSLDDVYLIAPEGVLKLDEIAGSDLQLSLPQVFLCKDDCRGLCPQCGADLNKTTCGCRADTVDPRLQVLKNLLKG